MNYQKFQQLINQLINYINIISLEISKKQINNSNMETKIHRALKFMTNQRGLEIEKVHCQKNALENIKKLLELGYGFHSITISKVDLICVATFLGKKIADQPLVSLKIKQSLSSISQMEYLLKLMQMKTLVPEDLESENIKQSIEIEILSSRYDLVSNQDYYQKLVSNPFLERLYLNLNSFLEDTKKKARLSCYTYHTCPELSKLFLEIQEKICQTISRLDKLKYFYFLPIINLKEVCSNLQNTRNLHTLSLIDHEGNLKKSVLLQLPPSVNKLIISSTIPKCPFSMFSDYSHIEMLTLHLRYLTKLMSLIQFIKLFKNLKECEVNLNTGGDGIGEENYYFLFQLLIQIHCITKLKAGDIGVVVGKICFFIIHNKCIMLYYCCLYKLFVINVMNYFLYIQYNIDMTYDII